MGRLCSLGCISPHHREPWVFKIIAPADQGTSWFPATLDLVLGLPATNFLASFHAWLAPGNWACLHPQLWRLGSLGSVSLHHHEPWEFKILAPASQGTSQLPVALDWPSRSWTCLHQLLDFLPCSAGSRELGLPVPSTLETGWPGVSVPALSQALGV